MNAQHLSHGERPPFRSIPLAPSAASEALGDLYAADLEHDAARTALIDLNRRIAERGWIDLEVDALRAAGERFVRAQTRRADVLHTLSLFLIAAPPTSEAAHA